ncbi:MAG TPA: 4Fe-4S dicluster domain-containing protein [Anaerolineaceae bacterium]|nr:4Fe-4S dicluster domain-containing protein [Anaerolineaceae bacterium]
MATAILYDSTKCIGCRSCEQACSAKWGLPYNDSIAQTEKLSEHKLTTVVTKDDHYMRRLCMHCQDPTCASVCPVGALQKTSAGPVIYHEDRCMGCRYCMVACPYHVPVYEWSKTLPKVRKCNMCAERLAQGQVTACSEACPTEATITGEREEILKEARKRLAENPDQYNGRIYGLTEVGGTSVFILSSIPPHEFGLPGRLPEEPLPLLTARVLAFVPDVVGVGGVLLGGIYWITHRREEVAAAEGHGKKTKPKQGGSNE